MSTEAIQQTIKRYKIIRIGGFITTTALVLLVLLSVCPIINHQQSVEATAGVAEVPTITITSASTMASVDITPTSSTGTFAVSDNSSRLAFSVSTSNYTGYTLKIKGNDNTGQLTNTSLGDTLDSITTATNENAFATGNTNTYVNKWGYRPNSFCTGSTSSSCSSNTNFLPSPTTSESVLDIQNTATSEDYTIDIAARVDYTKPVGTYTNTYILTATANPVAYAITYYDVNGTYDSTTKKMGFNQVGDVQASTINTSANITLAPTATPTRSTYTFAGWCLGSTDHSSVSVNDGITATYNAANTKVTAYHDPGTVCNGTVYATGASMPIDSTIDNTNINLYAVWTPTTFDQAYAAASKSKATESGLQYYKMQDMTASICNNVSPMQSTILVDYRKNVPAYDGTTTTGQVNGTAYHVAKLPDGRCWMLDNLYLNLNNQNVVNALSTSNTNTTAAAINALKNGGGTDSNGLAQTKLDYANWTSGAQYNKAMINRSGTCQSTTDSRCLYPYQKGTYNGTTYTGSYTYNNIIDKYGAITDTTTGEGVAATTYNIGLGNYKIGMYYNFCAATAGSYCYSSSHTDQNNASYDICPTSWRLPKSGAVVYPTTNYNEFQYLYNKIEETSSTPADSTTALSFQTMLSAPISGNYNVTTSSWQGSYGFLWSSSYYDKTQMYRIGITGTMTYLYGVATRAYRGYAVRCIAQN